MPPKFLENIVMLCFEGVFPNKMVFFQKSNILTPLIRLPPNLWSVYAMTLQRMTGNKRG